YRFIIEVNPTESTTAIRAKVWTEGFSEPPVWQIDCEDSSASRLRYGSIGCFSSGPGPKYWTNLTVVLSDSSPVEPGPGSAIRAQPGHLVIEVGSTANARVLDELDPLLDVTKDVLFAVADESIATATLTGGSIAVRGVAPGHTRIDVAHPTMGTAGILVDVYEPGGTSNGEFRTSITRGGITWNFSAPALTGQYVNGDWWVVGPVTIQSTSPSWDGRHHGSSINPRYGPRQGLDGRFAYDAALRVSFPKVVQANSSVVSVRSWKIGEQGAPVVPAAQTLQVPRPAIRNAAVLTVVAAPPPADSFRPGYAGTRKRVHTLRDLDLGILPELDPVAGMPSLSSVLGRFEGVWLDLIHAWQGRYLHPDANMPDYGRDICATFNEASLLLLLDIDPGFKRDLAIRLTQIGIDYYSVLQTGGEWGVIGGGIGSGRKWPILLAGALLNDSEMLSIGTSFSDRSFMEDCQTFFLTSSDLSRYPGKRVGDPVWGERHCDFGRGNYSDPGATGYQWCCTGNAWGGAALGARILGLMDLWHHPPYFAYQDWYMTQKAKGDWQRSWTGSFVENMWDTYRRRF
ncbi:MAG TPA: hypothetical protein VK116_06120, partial [Planctomycetota bacterium]|nr:hypothetical protein [Planctomycetota bacterium]